MSATHQTTILRAVPAGACLTTAQIAEATGLERKAVTQAAGKLIARDLLERTEIGCFRLTAAGAAAQAEGVELTCAPLAPSASHRRHPRALRVRVWRAARMARKFTIGEIEALAARDERQANGEVQRYLLALCRAGYLRRLRNGPGGQARYVLLRDSGPEAPMLTRDRASLRDPNTGAVHPCAIPSAEGPGDDR